MSSRRFLLNSPPQNGKAILEGEEVYHLSRVLRAEPGMEIELMDGFGQVWSGVIEQVNPELIILGQLNLLRKVDSTESKIDLVLAICRAEKLEWILQKTTEIGVANIYLLEADRSIAKVPPDRLQSKMDRWQKIIKAASKQSHRSKLPHLHPPLETCQLLSVLDADLKIMLSERAEIPALKTVLRQRTWRSAAFSIGPEGGWTPREERIFSESHFLFSSLGPNILRSETAAIVAAAILQYELEEI